MQVSLLASSLENIRPKFDSLVAINFAMTCQFPEKEYHIIYDAGASSIRASVVAFTPTAPPETSTKSKSKSKTAKPPKEGTFIEVKGIGYNLHSGGMELDRRLRELLADQLEKKHGKSMRGDERAMARLWKEAGRVKAILSANTDSYVAVSLLESPSSIFAHDISWATRSKA